MNKLLLSLLLIFCYSWIQAQSPITVIETEITIRANSTEEMFYGFAKGDKITLKPLLNKEIYLNKLLLQKNY